MIGTTLGHYRIAARIGAGGMGEVYRARDERLDRDVAIKVLPEAVAGDPERLKRFEREAKALAALSHPNIATVYGLERIESGSGTGSGSGSDPSLEPQASSPAVFLVMELLEGESLREVISSGRLTVAKAVEYARAIADGLAAAHDRGIVHRDLKPENVFLTKDGRIKILDFGLAKLRQPEMAAGTETPTASIETAEGTVIGTVPYMAPEQVRGEPADQRSDLFALGCVLYEMLAGRRPFAGATGAEIAAAILKEDPAPLPGTIPDALRNVIGRCLEKRPEDRFDSAHGLSLTLGALDIAAAPVLQEASFVRRRWPHMVAVAIAAVIAVLFVFPPQGLFERPAEEPTEAEPPRIVVLPFENLGSPEDEYFADGITEELISRLAAVSGLQVISRTSAMYYKGKSLPLKQIGDELDVGYVLEGTIRWDRSGGGHGRVRITPQLIRVEDDSHMWSERYDRVLEDIFEVQAGIAESVTSQLEVTLLAPERSVIEARPTDNVEAYQAFLRAKELLTHNEVEEDFDVAVDLLERAIGLDPSFAVAYGTLAEAHAAYIHYRVDISPERFARAEAAAYKALLLGPGLADVHVSRALYFYWALRDYDRALAELTAAVENRPLDAEARARMGWIYRRQGRFDDAVAELEISLELDPQNASNLWNHGVTLACQRDFEEAVGYIERAIALTPDDIPPYLRLWRAYLWWGFPDRARAALESMPGDTHPAAIRSLLIQDLFERNYEQALARLRGLPIREFQYHLQILPTSLIECECLRGLGRQAEAQHACENARQVLIGALGEQPDDPRIHSALGKTCALLGLKAEAIQHGERAVELWPVAKDALDGPAFEVLLAEIYVLVGEVDLATAKLEQLLSVPCSVTPACLRLDPAWDPLRDDPRFQALLEKYDTKAN